MPARTKHFRAGLVVAALRGIGCPVASTEGLAQAQRHTLGGEFEKANLVRFRRMEDQVPEAHLHIGPDALDLLVGIGGDDPARGRPLRRQRIGEPSLQHIV
jgi:hypothetical protein